MLKAYPAADVITASQIVPHALTLREFNESTKMTTAARSCQAQHEGLAAVTPMTVVAEHLEPFVGATCSPHNHEPLPPALQEHLKPRSCTWSLDRMLLESMCMPALNLALAVFFVFSLFLCRPRLHLRMPRDL